MKDNFYALTFYSVSLALQFEKLANDIGIDVELIPVPREISSSCDLAAKFLEERLDAVSTLIKRADYEYDSLYFVDKKTGKKPLKVSF